MLKKFNNGPIDEKMKIEMEKHFDYKWEHDKNFALVDEQFQNIVIQIPEELITQIYKKFLFGRFLHIFERGIFMIPKDTGHQHARYVWGDNEFSAFMQLILHSLEPI